MAEAMRRATRGGVDLLARKEAAMPAVYGLQIEINGGVCPAFADCRVDAHPDQSLVAYLNRRLGLAAPAKASTTTGRPHFYSTVMNLFPEAEPVITIDVALPKPGASRTWFADAGVLICRPSANARSRTGVAILGGHNAEPPASVCG